MLFWLVVCEWCVWVLIFVGGVRLVMFMCDDVVGMFVVVGMVVGIGFVLKWNNDNSFLLKLR